MIHKLAFLLLLPTLLFAADPWRTPSQQQIDAIYPQMRTLYEDLHRNPELSLHEEKTAAKVAEQLRKLGFEVTTGVGNTGVVGVLKNGPGPTVMIRAELDALPVLEKTELLYASHATTHNDQGIEVPVMHACGHDLHMSVGMGTAALLAQNKDRWHGTFLYVGQPAEERIVGATAMLKDGLFTRFPKPDYAFAIHDTSFAPAGAVNYVSGFAMSNADSLDVTIYGKGGHGSAPELTVDPIVIAARTILSWQTIISREKNPQDPGVITVGTIHGGTKNNIIPDDVKLQLTVRSYADDVRQHLLAAIERVVDGEAGSCGCGKEASRNANRGRAGRLQRPCPDPTDRRGARTSPGKRKCHCLSSQHGQRRFRGVRARGRPVSHVESRSRRPCEVPGRTEKWRNSPRSPLVAVRPRRRTDPEDRHPCRDDRRPGIAQ
jgi:amidohydrolase